MFPISPLVEFVGGKPKETEMKDEMKEEKLDLEKVQRICFEKSFGATLTTPFHHVNVTKNLKMSTCISNQNVMEITSRERN